MNLFRTRRIYMDYASAPPVLPAARRAMREAEHLVGNPGAIHAEAVEAKARLERARERVARTLGTKAREIMFVSGLTEANNLAILGFARHLERTRRTLEGTHWLVSAIEHASVLECFAEIERLGGEVTNLAPDSSGVIAADALAKALKKETVFVSVGWANNEIGTVQPLREMAAVIRTHEEAMASHVVFHSDAGQAPLYLASTMHSIGVDLLSLGSNKLYGPHGIGALAISSDTALAPILFGGKQERGLRAGTENVALASGFAAAYEQVVGEREAESKRIKKIRDDFATRLCAEIPGLVINGDLRHTLPHMLNVSIPHISSEYVTLALDARGIALSTKSACREGEESRSHAVAALGEEAWRATNTLRFSLGRGSQPSDIAKVVQVLKEVVARQCG